MHRSRRIVFPEPPPRSVDCFPRLVSLTHAHLHSDDEDTHTCHPLSQCCSSFLLRLSAPQDVCTVFC